MPTKIKENRTCGEKQVETHTCGEDHKTGKIQAETRTCGEAQAAIPTRTPSEFISEFRDFLFNHYTAAHVEEDNTKFQLKQATSIALRVAQRRGLAEKSVEVQGYHFIEQLLSENEFRIDVESTDPDIQALSRFLLLSLRLANCQRQRKALERFYFGLCCGDSRAVEWGNPRNRMRARDLFWEMLRQHELVFAFRDSKIEIEDLLDTLIGQRDGGEWA